MLGSSNVELSCSSDDQSMNYTVEILFPSEPQMAWIGSCLGPVDISNSFYKLNAICVNEGEKLFDWHKTIDRNNGRFTSYWWFPDQDRPGETYKGLCKKADPKL